MGHEIIYSSIPIGKENAVHLQTLCEEWGVSTTQVKQIIRDARMQGVEICSGIDGYWIAADHEDGKSFIKAIKTQAFTRLKTARAVNNSLNVDKGQTSLNFEQMGVSNQ